MNDIKWQPWPGPQTDFCSRWEFEVLYGGAAGGGKTDCIVAEALRDVGNEDYRGILLRRTFPESEEIIDRCENLYHLLGGEYVNKFWHFPSGAKIKVGSMQREKDKYAYRGKTYHYIGFDETSMFSPTQYLYLFSRCRSTNPNIKPRIRGGTNPGGEGHQFLKDRFQIGIIPPGQTIFDARTGLSRVFIPAKLKDNPTLALNDPDYVKRLMALPELERMRLMEGLWDAFEGQAIPELNIDVHAMERHGMKPSDIPKEWPRYRSFDWGYATPFSVGWWAADIDGRLYRYREWYGQKEGDERNVGLRMNATEVAREIRRIEHDANEKILPGPADPDIWNPRWQGFSGKKFGVVGGSVAEDMAAEGVHFLQADNDRILGRQQVHKRLELDERGDPQIMVSVECKDFWRTMPLLREYHGNPEDIESKHVEDHIYSEVRYMCMFKPAKPKLQEPNTFNTFQHERKKLIKARQLATRRGISLADAYGRVR